MNYDAFFLNAISQLGLERNQGVMGTGNRRPWCFTSGYVSNQTGIATIAKLLPDCLILSDARNHNSMIEGIRQSGVERQMWRHNDVDNLETLLRAAAGRPKLIAFESLYSMDGDVAPIRRICELAELCIKPMRSWLVPCYEPTPPDPLACCDASLPART